MKTLPIVLASALLLPVPALAEGQAGYSRQCFKEVYREEYIPGTVERPGRVRRWTEQKEVPCRDEYTIQPYPYPNPHRSPYPLPENQTYKDENSCVEGSVIGGLLGGGLGGILSNQENWILTVPAGIVGGAMVGCQIDGG